MKKITLMLLTLVLALLCSVAFACGGGKDKENDGNTGDETPDGEEAVKLDGTYYYVEDGIFDYSMYITFKNGTWTDDENQSGSYTLSDDAVTMYITVDGEKTEYATGYAYVGEVWLTIMGVSYQYCKVEDTASVVPEKTLVYELSGDRTYYIVKGIGELTGDITVPDEYKKKPVKEIAENAFANSGELTSIVIGNNVTTVGQKAFYKCANLTEVVLGEKVSAIEESTFEECKKLESITVPASVKSIGKKAFYFCLALEDINYTGTVTDWAEIDFYYYIGYNTIEVSNPVSDNNIYIVGNNTAYADNTSRNLNIDGTLLTNAGNIDAWIISPFAFYGYEGLQSATVANVGEIGEYAFYKCSNLSALQFNGSSLTDIGEGAFAYCEQLQSVTLPAGLKRIEQYAFNSCSSLSGVAVGNGTKYIGYGAFMSCEKLSSLTLGSSVVEIGEAAFYGCEGLGSVTIPASVIFIGKDAFWATRLTSATFENKEGWVVNKDVPLASEELEDTANAAKLLVSSILMQGYADTDWEKPTLQYTLSADGTYYIVNNVGTACRAEIVIPSTYKEKPVKEFANYAFENCKSLESITIPDSITTIGNNAFYGCSDLKIYYAGDIGSWCQISGLNYLMWYGELYIYGKQLEGELIIPDGVTEISTYAFYNCKFITSVTIPDGVTSIGNGAFNSCNSLTSVTIPSSVTSIGNGAFEFCYKLNSVYYTGDIADWCNISGLGTLTRTIDQSMSIYIDGKQIKGDLIIPEGVTDIKDYAFYGFDITNVTIPSSVTSVGDAFRYFQNIYYTGDIESWCKISGLRYLTEHGKLNIKDKQLEGELIIPDGVTEIPASAFYGCEYITGVTIPDSVTKIGERAFYGCSGIESVTLGENVKIIGGGAFSYCSSLVSIVIPNGVEYIYEVFNGCTSLTGVIIPDSVISVYSTAFKNCPIETATLPAHAINSINNENLKTVVITSGEEITDNAFDGCRLLESVTIPEGVRLISRYAFRGCESLTSITLPISVYGMLTGAFDGCTNLKSIYHMGDVGTWCAMTGLEYLMQEGRTLYIGGEELEGEIIIPDSGYYIGGYAFAYCTKITSVSIPWRTSVIYSSAFLGCSSLESVTFGANLSFLGDCAFKDCVSLTEITFYGGYSFNGIKKNTFSGCSNLKKITIGGNIPIIESEAFLDCTSLTEIIFDGTVEEWNAITKEDGWDKNTGKYTVYCQNENVKKSAS